MNKLQLFYMYNLLESRRTAKGYQSPIKLENLSPQKYGKGAYADLVYTPSKLADNILYREVTTLKKIEEGNGKRRQSQALNTLFQDRLNQLREERDGIELSLTQQIMMYKKLLQQAQIKYEAHLREVQQNFKNQISELITEKEEEAKYSQAEKEILENRIAELENQLEKLQCNLKNSGSDMEDLKNQKEKLDIKYSHICQKLEELEKKSKQEADKAEENYNNLYRKLLNSEAAWEKKLEDEVIRHQKDQERLELLQKNELQKIENKREAENFLKNQEIKEIQSLFNEQADRLSQIIHAKQIMVEGLSADLANEKKASLQLTKSYEKEINFLSHENSALINDVKHLKNEKVILSKQLNNLKELLMESAVQLQKCKEEFLRISKERDLLFYEMKQLGGENRILHQLKVEKESEARGWKESYYMNRNLF